jgi:hypothetical protein
MKVYDGCKDWMEGCGWRDTVGTVVRWKDVAGGM